MQFDNDIGCWKELENKNMVCYDTEHADMVHR